MIDNENIMSEERVTNFRMKKPIIKVEPSIRRTISSKSSEKFNRKAQKLYEESLADLIPNEIFSKIVEKDNILEAYKTIKNNKTLKQFLFQSDQSDKETIKNLKKILKESYKVKLPELDNLPILGSDEQMPIVVSPLQDRLVQVSFKQILEPIIKAQVSDSSFGFQTGKTIDKAIAKYYDLAEKGPYHYVVNIKIKNFSQNVDVKKLKDKLLRLGIYDQKVLKIINLFLQSSKWFNQDKKIHGIFQSGDLYPILAEAIFISFDSWLAKLNIKNKKNFEILPWRYKDTIKIFCKNFDDAKYVQSASRKWFDNILYIPTTQEDIEIINLLKDFDELKGIETKLIRFQKKYAIKSQITEKARKAIEEVLVDRIKSIKNAETPYEKSLEIGKYNAAVMGIHDYFKKATEIKHDMFLISHRINLVMYNQVLKYEALVKKGKPNPNTPISKRYGFSKYLRYIDGEPLVPIEEGYYDQTNNEEI